MGRNSDKSLDNNVTKTVSIDPESIISSLIQNPVEPQTADKWKYEIKDELGKGGIGRVLIAFDDKIGRDIALKELIKENLNKTINALPDQKLRADEIRFLREARVTGQLEHPGIVPVYEIGRKPDGNHYYTMKLVRGMTLAQAIHAAGTLEKRIRLLPHFRDICNAIAYSHSRGVIHRDIKPENIMIGEFGETVVLDWGLAKVKGEADSAETELREELNFLKIDTLGKTVKGKAIGTPAYMSPEQAKGEISEIDERSDVYSLGAVLYEILTGHEPFKGRNVKETLEMVKSEYPVEITLYEPEAPADLCAVVSKTLTREKESRYQSALDVAKEIEIFMSGGKIKAYEYSSWELFKRFSQKNKSLTVLITALILVLIMGSVIIFHAYRESVKNERTAHLNLSLGYLEYAERLLKERRYLNAKIFSTASLYHNPYNRKSPWKYSDIFLDENQEESSNQMLSIQSVLYLSTVYQNNSFKNDLILTSFDARDIAVSPDGSMIAVVGKKRAVTVYSAIDGKEKFVLTGHKDEISSIDFSPDGKYLASGSWDRSLILWDAREGILIKSVECPESEIYSVSFSNDSKYIAFGGTDKNLWIAEIDQFKIKAEKIIELSNTVRSIDWSVDSKKILVSDSSGEIYLIENGKLKTIYSYHDEPVISIKFLKDGHHFISTGYDKKLVIWDIYTTNPLNILEHWDAFYDMDISSDSSIAAAATRDGTIKLINLKTRQIEDLRGHEGSVYSVSFMPMGNSLVSIGEDRLIKVWDAEIKKTVSTFKGHSTYIPSLCYSPDGKYLASSSWDTTIKLWNIENEMLLSSFGKNQTVSYSIAFSKDGQYLATGDSDGYLRLWNPLTGKIISAIKGHSDQISAIAFFNDGIHLVSGGKDRNVFLWDMQKQKIITKLSHSHPVHAVSISEKNKLIASGGRNGEINFWNYPKGEKLFGTKGIGKTILSIAFSLDGLFAFTAMEDGTINKWSINEKKIVEILSGHSGPANSITFSSDGLFFASVGKEVIIWNTSNSNKEMFFDLQYNGYSISFEKDNRHFSVSDGATIKRFPVILEMWKSDPLKLMKEAENQAGKKLKGFKLVSNAENSL